MKYLGSYIDKPMSEMIKRNGGFYAFSNEQFEEQKQEGVKYVRMGMGLIAPKENAKNIFRETEEIHKKGIKADVEENGIKRIIRRECANHEIQFGNTEAVYDKLSEYPITREEIDKGIQKYIEYCIKNDLY